MIDRSVSPNVASPSSGGWTRPTRNSAGPSPKRATSFMYVIFTADPRAAPRVLSASHVALYPPPLTCIAHRTVASAAATALARAHVLSSHDISSTLTRRRSSAIGHYLPSSLMNTTASGS